MKSAHVDFLTKTSMLVFLAAATAAAGCTKPEIKTAGEHDGEGGSGADDGSGGSGGGGGKSSSDDGGPTLELPDLGPPETLRPNIDDGGGCNTRNVKYSSHTPTVALLLD